MFRHYINSKLDGEIKLFYSILQVLKIIEIIFYINKCTKNFLLYYTLFFNHSYNNILNFTGSF